MDLEIFENTLTGLREELLGRVERTHRHIYESKERGSANFSDQSQELENQELVLNLDLEARTELRLVEEALDRISNRTFGVCQKCGKGVQTQRLDAIPYTN